MTGVEFREAVETNVLSIILTTREAIRAFGPRGRSISVPCRAPTACQVPVVYSASKVPTRPLLALANELALFEVKRRWIERAMRKSATCDQSPLRLQCMSVRMEKIAHGRLK
jgi:NAD(P)-dependent dehydrogenase (short-subunit alcohol dehydrogenase family)